MRRRAFVTIVAAMMVGLAWTQSAHAIRISRNNPYRSFSISGYNYGAVQWERQQRSGNGNSSYQQNKNQWNWSNFRSNRSVPGYRTYRR